MYHDFTKLVTSPPPFKKKKEISIIYTQLYTYLINVLDVSISPTGNSLGDFFPTCNICLHTIGPDKIHLNRHNLNSLSMKSDLETFNDKNFIIYIINKATGLDNRVLYILYLGLQQQIDPSHSTDNFLP